EWVAPKYTGAGGAHLTGLDCYGFRCSMLHQGRLAPHKGGYTRVLFIEPGRTPVVLHNNVINDALNIEVNIFVNDVVERAVAWHEQASQTTAYQANYPHFMQRYPEGLPPYI